METRKVATRDIMYVRPAILSAKAIVLRKRNVAACDLIRGSRVMLLKVSVLEVGPIAARDPNGWFLRAFVFRGLFDGYHYFGLLFV